MPELCGHSQVLHEFDKFAPKHSKTRAPGFVVLSNSSKGLRIGAFTVIE